MAGDIAATVGGAVINAIKAMGMILTVDPEDFLNVLNKHHQYLTSYKGLAFFTKSQEKLPMPLKTELITVKKILMPVGIFYEE